MIRYLSDGTGNVLRSYDYFPYGECIPVSNGTDPEAEYLFSGKEKQDHLFALDWYDSGARFQTADGIFISIDPLAEKYYHISPYAYCAGNPISLVDFMGKEPIKNCAGTVAGFVNFMKTIKTGIAYTRGEDAHAAMLRMGIIKFKKGIEPANTGPFNTSNGNRYIYTKEGGWIDMAHFMFYAGRAYNYKIQKQLAQEFLNGGALSLLSPEEQLRWLKTANMDPVGEAIQDGYLQESGDVLFAPHSAYSYEDLPSDKYGADFGVNYFDPNSHRSFSEQIQYYLNNVLKATEPAKAPNYDYLPTDYPKKPTHTNRTTIPIYITPNL